jgi:hypothetical protein
MYKSHKIAVFYHLYQINTWREIFEAQYARMQSSGLAEHVDYFHVGVNTSEFQSLPDLKIDSVVINSHVESEADTLNALWNFCSIHPDYHVLYFHSKGVSHTALEFKTTIINWVEYLEYFVIDRWRSCVLQLQTHDCAGTEWIPQHIVELNSISSCHYAGNFWWANANYLASLDPTFLYQSRHSPELWINTLSPNYYNFWFSNRDLYWHNLYPEEYKNILLDEL